MSLTIHINLLVSRSFYVVSEPFIDLCPLRQPLDSLTASWTAYCPAYLLTSPIDPEHAADQIIYDVTRFDHCYATVSVGCVCQNVSTLSRASWCHLRPRCCISVSRRAGLRPSSPRSARHCRCALAHSVECTTSQHKERLISAFVQAPAQEYLLSSISLLFLAVFNYFTVFVTLAIHTSSSSLSSSHAMVIEDNQDNLSAMFSQKLCWGELKLL